MPYPLDKFIFGTATIGETVEHNGRKFSFHGDFCRRKDAILIQKEKISQGHECCEVSAYSNGNRKRGWAVYSSKQVAAK